MMPALLQKLFQNQLVRYALILLIGVGIGAVFYPTSSVEEKLHKKYEEETKTLVETHQQEVKTLRESYDKSVQEYNSYKQESEKKVQRLIAQVQSLQSKQKTSYYKVVKPDGTVEIKKFSESEVNESSTTINSIQEEFKTKVQSIEQKWEAIHKQKLEDVKKDFAQKEETYKHRIEELESSKTIKTNEKEFGVEGGMNTDKQYYIHGTGDLYGPLFMGLHLETNKEFDNKSLGVGLGVKF